MAIEQHWGSGVVLLNASGVLEDPRDASFFGEKLVQIPKTQKVVVVVNTIRVEGHSSSVQVAWIKALTKCRAKISRFVVATQSPMVRMAAGTIALVGVNVTVVKTAEELKVELPQNLQKHVSS